MITNDPNYDAKAPQGALYLRTAKKSGRGEPPNTDSTRIGTLVSLSVLDSSSIKYPKCFWPELSLLQDLVHFIPVTEKENETQGRKVKHQLMAQLKLKPNSPNAHFVIFNHSDLPL